MGRGAWLGRGGQWRGQRREQGAGGQRLSWRLVMLFEDWRRYFERFEAGGIHLFCLSRLSSSKRHWLHSWPVKLGPPTESQFSSSSSSASTASAFSTSPERGMVRRRLNPSTPAMIPIHFQLGIFERSKSSLQIYRHLEIWPLQ